MELRIPFVRDIVQALSFLFAELLVEPCEVAAVDGDLGIGASRGLQRSTRAPTWAYMTQLGVHASLKG